MYVHIGCICIIYHLCVCACEFVFVRVYVYTMYCISIICRARARVCVCVCMYVCVCVCACVCACVCVRVWFMPGENEMDPFQKCTMLTAKELWIISKDLHPQPCPQTGVYCTSSALFCPFTLSQSRLPFLGVYCTSSALLTLFLLQLLCTVCPFLPSPNLACLLPPSPLPPPSFLTASSLLQPH